MATEEIRRRYFDPPSNASWQWDDSGDFIERSDGSKTIAHRLLLRKILSDLNLYGNGGLPRFPLVVAYLEEIVLDPLATDLNIRIPFETVERVLDHHQGSEMIDRLLVPMAPPRSPHWSDREQALTEVGGLFAGLAELRAKSPEELEHLAETGLVEAPVAAEPIELADRVASIMGQLDEDPTLAGIAKLTRKLLGLVHLPKSVSDPQDLPLGGFSDITNKGQIDRLLLSELAHDDDVLMSRIAMREALYLRRESPPVPRPETCQVLLDSTVRMWGVPRVFALAVGLAVVLRSGTRENTARRGREMVFFHTDDDDLEAVDLGSAEGLKAHLAHLDFAHLPSGGLGSLIEPPVGSNREPATETLLVTNEEIFEDPDFLAAVDVPPEHTVYIATVHRAGRFCLWHIGERSRKMLQSGQLDLSVIAPNENIVDPTLLSDRFPDYFRLGPSPIRLPNKYFKLSLENLCFCPRRGALGITKHGEVVHIPGAADPNFPEHTKLPQSLRFITRGNKTFGPFWNGEGGAGWVALVNQGRRLHFVQQREDGGFSGKDQQSSGKLSHAVIHRGKWHLFFPKTNRMETWDVDGTKTGEGEWHSSQGTLNQWGFTPRGWVLRSKAGGEPDWEQLDVKAEIDAGGTLLRRPSDGEFFMLSPAMTTVRKVGESKNCAVFPNAQDGGLDGRRFQDGFGFSKCGLYFGLGQCIDLEAMTLKLEPLDWNLRKRLSPLGQNTISVNCTSVGIWDRRVVLERKENFYALKRRRDGTLEWEGMALRMDRSVFREFGRAETPPVWGTKLRVATFDCGSRVWIDHRGLLHLRSHDAAAESVTISLEVQCAAWTSDGVLVGSDLQVDQAKGDSTDVMAAIASFARSVRT